MSVQPPFPPGPGQQPPYQPQQQPQGYGPPTGYTPGYGSFSPDGRFVWNGQQWIPTPGASNKSNVALIILGSCGVMFLIAIVVIVILTVVGKQVSNVFSNVSDGLQTPTTMVRYLIGR